MNLRIYLTNSGAKNLIKLYFLINLYLLFKFICKFTSYKCSVFLKKIKKIKKNQYFNTFFVVLKETKSSGFSGQTNSTRSYTVLYIKSVFASIFIRYFTTHLTNLF